MKRWFFLFALPPLVSACDQPAIKAATCPTAPVDILRVVFNQTENRYSVFHMAAPGAPKLANPLLVENLQMVQMPADANRKTDYARMSFKAENGKCNPLLEMTQGYKIELTQGATRVAGEGSAASGGSGGGSSWAPFLMGAVAGHVLSNALSPPAYYLPPPSAGHQTGGMVTGGVGASSPTELNKKYESQYNQPVKKGFFSNRSASPEGVSEKRSGFFNRKSNPSPDSNRSRGGGFFKKR